MFYCYSGLPHAAENKVNVLAASIISIWSALDFVLALFPFPEYVPERIAGYHLAIDQFGRSLLAAQQVT
jgi:hypothetical protein